MHAQKCMLETVNLVFKLVKVLPGQQTYAHSAAFSPQGWGQAALLWSSSQGSMLQHTYHTDHEKQQKD